VTRARRVACIVASAFFGIAAGIATVPRAAPPSAAADVSAASHTAAWPASWEPARAITPNAPLPAMPDGGVPLARAYSALATRAEAGDREAAARLVAEVDRCRGLPALVRGITERNLSKRRWRRELDGPYAAAASQQLAATETVAARDTAEVEARKALCAGVADSRLGELGHWIYRSAALGDAKAAQRFASGTWIAVNESSTLDDNAIAFWRAHALEMAKRALAGGELSASIEIAQAYYGAAGLAYVPEGGGTDYLGAALTRDPMRSAAYLRVATMTGFCDDCYFYAMQMERDFGGTVRDDARAEAEHICTTELAGRCTHTNEYLTR
jgi:hypothetical protein